MEFMSSGVPALAPDNTAMADYISEDNAFIVKSTIEPAVWPQNPSLSFRTTHYRINWESLYNAFRESYRVATRDREHYRHMTQAAAQSLHQYCSLEKAIARLANFLDLTRERR